MALAFAGPSMPFAAAGRPRGQIEEPRVTVRALAFGTRVAVTIVGWPVPEARSAASAALRRIAEVDALTALHAPSSALAQLNRDGQTHLVNADLTILFQHARHWSKASAGAFDITVQPLWQRHFAASVAGRAASPVELERARSLVDWRGIELSGSKISFARAGMMATLNGLAQGYASDQAWAVLKGLGVRHALVDAGEPLAMGRNDRGRLWQLGVRQPASTSATAMLADIVELRDAALATSGDDGFCFTPDRRLHHILDPGSGYSPPELSGVTVLAPDACTADALSTTCMVMGVERSLALLSTLGGVEAVLIRKDGTRVTTPGWPVRNPRL